MEHIRIHPATPADTAASAALRTMVLPKKGMMRGAAARTPYDEIMTRVSPPEGVIYEADTVGGIKGWWCTPPDELQTGALCHFHGGWFNFGSAQAFRHLVGHIASAAGVAAFIPEYRLAPEHPFPAAIEDAERCYQGLVDRGYTKLAVTGDSAGGNLALVLLSRLKQVTALALPAPVGAVALSPATDLALTGASWSDRADADPYFTRSQVTELVSSYLGGLDPTEASASPLYGNLQNLPPVRIHVGNDEVLLDDTKSYIEKAAALGVDAEADVWECMAHGFLSGAGKFDASNEALAAIGKFLKERFGD